MLRLQNKGSLQIGDQGFNFQESGRIQTAFFPPCTAQGLGPVIGIDS